jgi:hypothetical protein
MGLKDIFTNPGRFKFYGGAGYPTPNLNTGGVNGVEPLLTLKYGKDSPGGGASRQPFIVTPIPGASATFNTNGLVIARSATDVERLSKFFTTTPGLLFIAKQNVLSQTNVRTQAADYNEPKIQPNNGPYLPTNTLAQVGLSVAGAHFNKQGLLPDGYFSPKYVDVIPQIKGEDNTGIGNRLLQLTTNKIVYYNQPNNSKVNILTYKGGPGAFLGVGSTNIQFANKGGSAPRVNLYKNTDLNIYNYLVTTYNGLGYLAEGKNTTTGSVNNGAVTITANPKFSDINIRSAYNYSPLPQEDFRKTLINRLTGVENAIGTLNSSIISLSPDYTKENIENRVNLGNPGTRGNIVSYTKGKILSTSTESEPLDKINAKPLYRSQFVDKEGTNDLVKFRIEVIDNNEPAFGTFIHFRAFIDSFSDNYTANWSDTQYIGRGEKFYTYDSFLRTINMSWTVAAQSKDELIPMYQKLNYLASSLAPTYNSKGYMSGTLVRLTVGGYLYSQPGFITSLTYDVPSESPWEIGINDIGGSDPSVKELPHMIRVSGFNFTPIHTFAPQKQTNTYGGKNRLVATTINEVTKKETKYFAKNVTEFGDQRFIALSTGNNNNYDANPIPLLGDPNDQVDLTGL